MVKRLYSSIILTGISAVPPRMLSLLGSWCDETVLVTADPLHHLDFDGLIVAPVHGGHDPFSAIYAGLFAAAHPHALVVDARRFDFKAELMQYLLDAVEPRWDLVIPETASGFEPGLAVYSKRCLKPMAQHMGRGSFNPDDLYAKLNTLVIPESVLKANFPDWGSSGEIVTTET